MLSKEHFGSDFKWGVSTAAYQIEGAALKDGKGPSIWDEFVKQKGKIARGESGKDACHFYENYAKDLTLMAHMNIFNYRFSISWSRILPEGTGKVNQHGVDYYNRVIDLCLELGIEPWITLYHWDLPLALESKGGWANREIISWFSYFTECCLKNFGGKVKNWIILNEPVVFTGAGYFLGLHAPGKKGLSNFLQAAHHAALCQAEGGRIVRSYSSTFNIGTTFSCSHLESFTSDESDKEAVKKVDVILNRFFVEPLLGLGYPTKDLKVAGKIEKYMKDGDEQRLAFDMDFIGLQNYTREIVKANNLIPYIGASIVKANKRKVEATLMNWEVYPPSIYQVLKKFNCYNKIREFIITENGAAFTDKLVNGKVHDQKRTQFLSDHIAEVYRAKKDGVNVKGYFIWTFLDNFEWAEGFKPRFGIVHVDFETQKRTIKDSGLWYKEFLQQKGEEIKLQFAV
ncbi:MAG: GH1 family beta-glucosidase [Ginsengibacter sp.]